MSVYILGSEHTGVVKFFQFWCVFEIFQNKILEKRNSMHYDVVVWHMHLKYIEKQIEIIVLKRASIQFSSVQSLSHVRLLWPHGLQHARPPCPSTTPRVYSNSWPLSLGCHPTISSSVIPFFSHLRSFPESRSFQMSQLLTSGGQSTGVTGSMFNNWSYSPMNIQDWFSFGWTGWISLKSKGLSRVFSNTTVQKHQFFGAQVCL